MNMESFEDSNRTAQNNEGIETSVEKWHWSLSDEQWEKLQAYLSQTEEGEQRLQIYRNVRETGEIPSCIDAEQWESQWNEDLQQAGI
jgi:hypothetical protein